MNCENRNRRHFLAVATWLVLASSLAASSAQAVDSIWNELSWLSGPAARANHSVIYDPLNRRMVAFGGEGASLYQDVWWLSLDSLVWHPMNTSGTPPAAREGHGAIYDPDGDRMIVFGGETATSEENALWALTLPTSGTPTWSELVAHSGSCGSLCPRSDMAVAFDTTTHSMIIMGGNRCNGYDMDDTWRQQLSSPYTRSKLDGIATCSNQSDAWAPERRSYHAMIYDEEQTRLVMFGGSYLGAEGPGTLWASETGADWSQWDGLGWEAQGHVALYDGSHDRMIVFGGLNGTTNTYALSLPSGEGEWSQVATSGSSPSLFYHDGILDPVCDRMLVFGGLIGSATDKTWVLDFPDSIPPVAIDDLHVISTTSNSATLAWTAPGDDGTGPCSARSYDIRYSTSLIDYSNFASASVVSSPPKPGAAGTTQTKQVTSLSNQTTYYFAIKTTDYSNNTSVISNLTCATPGGICLDDLGQTPPIPRASAARLDQVRPNPARGELHAEFTLADASPATLELIDIAGRRVETIEVGSLGAGNHQMDLGRKVLLPAGYYRLRLRTGEVSHSRPVVIVR